MTGNAETIRAALEGIIRRVTLISPHYENARYALAALEEMGRETLRLDWLIANGARDREAIDQILKDSESHAALLANLPGLPVADMIDRGWLSPVSGIGDARLESALFKFFEVGSAAELREVLYGDGFYAAMQPTADAPPVATSFMNSPCPACSGTGKIPLTNDPCRYCEGKDNA